MAFRHFETQGFGAQIVLLPRSLQRPCLSLEGPVHWALEYHALVFFGVLLLKGDHHEMHVYTFFPGYLKAQYTKAGGPKKHAVHCLWVVLRLGSL